MAIVTSSSSSGLRSKSMTLKSVHLDVSSAWSGSAMLACTMRGSAHRWRIRAALWVGWGGVVWCGGVVWWCGEEVRRARRGAVVRHRAPASRGASFAAVPLPLPNEFGRTAASGDHERAACINSQLQRQAARHSQPSSRSSCPLEEAAAGRRKKWLQRQRRRTASRSARCSGCERT